MTQILLEQFAGIAPKVHPTKLGDALATIAENVRFERASLTPINDIVDQGPVPNGTKSIYPYAGTWLTSTFRRQYVGTLLPNDSRRRIYYTDVDYPKVRSGNQEFRLGLPRPAAPIVVVEEEGDLEDLTAMRVQAYTVCWVDAWGAEGPPSNITIPVEVGEGARVRVELPSVPTGAYNLGPGALIRIYRSNTGSEGSLFQYLAEVPVGTGQILDDIESVDLQEAIPSDTWIGPPDDDRTRYPDGPLRSLIELPGGILAGHTGNTICFSEPYLPHAWPLAYRISSADKIVAIAMIQGGLFVATEGRPYLIVGSSPDALARIPIESTEACVSAESMVDMGDYAIYASANGLVAAAGNTAALITSEFFDDESWEAVQPETIRAMAYEGKYLAFYGDLDDGTGFIFDPRGETTSLVTFTAKVNAGYMDLSDGELYVVFKDPQGQWRRGHFDKGAPLSLNWQSKVFLTETPVSFSVVRVEADAYPVELELIADGVSRLTVSVPDDEPLRLPGGFVARKWQFRVSGATTINRIGLWDSMAEVS